MQRLPFRRWVAARRGDRRLATGVGIPEPAARGDTMMSGKPRNPTEEEPTEKIQPTPGQQQQQDDGNGKRVDHRNIPGGDGHTHANINQ
jgi:hypothetical protein